MSDPKLAPSSELVAVRAMLPETRQGGGAILMKRDGSFLMLLRTGGVNFDMKSHYEQAAITYAFGSLVNSLTDDFPLQIVAHARRLDVDAYVRQYLPRLNNERTPPQIRRLISEHVAHFEDSVKQNNMLQREFYLVIPWNAPTATVEKSFSDDIPLAPLFKTVMRQAEKKLAQVVPSDQDIAIARQQLDLRAELMQRKLGQMQLWSERMDEDAIYQLLHHYFNPGLAERQAAPTGDYEGRLISGFSAQQTPSSRRRITDGQTLERPSFG